MKIDWLLAPWWAQWFAIDEDGTGWWYATKPVVNKANNIWQIDEKQNQWGFQLAGHQGDDFGDWEQSVLQRPIGGTNDKA